MLKKILISFCFFTFFSCKDKPLKRKEESKNFCRKDLPQLTLFEPNLSGISSPPLDAKKLAITTTDVQETQYTYSKQDESFSYKVIFNSDYTHGSNFYYLSFVCNRNEKISPEISKCDELTENKKRSCSCNRVYSDSFVLDAPKFHGQNVYVIAKKCVTSENAKDPNHLCGQFGKKKDFFVKVPKGKVLTQPSLINQYKITDESIRTLLAATSASQKVLYDQILYEKDNLTKLNSLIQNEKMAIDERMEKLRKLSCALVQLSPWGEKDDSYLQSPASIREPFKLFVLTYARAICRNSKTLANMIKNGFFENIPTPDLSGSGLSLSTENTSRKKAATTQDPCVKQAAKNAQRTGVTQEEINKIVAGIEFPKNSFVQEFDAMVKAAAKDIADQNYPTEEVSTTSSASNKALINPVKIVLYTVASLLAIRSLTLLYNASSKKTSSADIKGAGIGSSSLNPMNYYRRYFWNKSKVRATGYTLDFLNQEYKKELKPLLTSLEASDLGGLDPKTTKISKISFNPNGQLDQVVFKDKSGKKHSMLPERFESLFTQTKNLETRQAYFRHQYLTYEFTKRVRAYNESSDAKRNFKKDVVDSIETLKGELQKGGAYENFEKFKEFIGEKVKGDESLTSFKDYITQKTPEAETTTKYKAFVKENRLETAKIRKLKIWKTIFYNLGLYKPGEDFKIIGAGVFSEKGRADFESKRQTKNKRAWRAAKGIAGLTVVGVGAFKLSLADSCLSDPKCSDYEKMIRIYHIVLFDSFYRLELSGINLAKLEAGELRALFDPKLK